MRKVVYKQAQLCGKKTGEKEDEKKKIKAECDSSSAKGIESKSDVKEAGIQDIDDYTDNGSSSSDFDVIDENGKDGSGTTSCFTPSTCTISSSSIASESSNCRRSGRAYNTAQSGSSSKLIFDKRLNAWITIVLQYLQNLSGLQWGCLFGLSLVLLICINLTIINALHQKGIVASQMDKNINNLILKLHQIEIVASQMDRNLNELRNDIKVLKVKILAIEMKIEKLKLTFEHQIRELQKENIKLNNMLEDLEKEKYSENVFSKIYKSAFRQFLNTKENGTYQKGENSDKQLKFWTFCFCYLLLIIFILFIIHFSA